MGVIRLNNNEQLEVLIFRVNLLLRYGGGLLNKVVDFVESQFFRELQIQKVKDLYRVNRSSLLIAIHTTK